MTDLGTLGGRDSQATGINNAGQVIGRSDTSNLPLSVFHPFLYSNGVMTDLAPGSAYGEALGINSAGDVVGWYTPFDSGPSGSAFHHAFLYSRGIMTDLGSLLRWDNYAYAINDAGQIVACCSSKTGHLVLMTPVQPPVANAGLNQTISQGRRVYLSGALSSDPRGLPLTYAWTIQSAPAGNTATLTGANTVTPSLIPNVAGIYVISLVVNDGQSSSAASTVTVNVTPNLPPNTVVRGIPTSGYAPLTVQFSAVGSTDPEGGPLTYLWSFGDGATATSIASAHIYVVPGSYTAAVTVTDDVGNAVNVPMVITVVPNPPPTIAPTVTPADGTAPLNVQFVAHAVDPDGDPLTVTWSFGDGNTAVGDATSHTYNKAGTYTATVTVSDGVNPPVSASLTVNVRFPLVISEAEVGFNEEGKGNIDFKATFSYPDLPMSADTIKIGFGGIPLLEIAFANFKMEAPGVYEYEQEDVHAKIDFNRHTIKVDRHNIVLTSLDNSNGIDIAVVFGAVTGTSHITMQEKIEKHGESKEWTYTSSNNM